MGKEKTDALSQEEIDALLVGTESEKDVLPTLGSGQFMARVVGERRGKSRVLDDYRRAVRLRRLSEAEDCRDYRLFLFDYRGEISDVIGFFKGAFSRGSKLCPDITRNFYHLLLMGGSVYPIVGRESFKIDIKSKLEISLDGEGKDYNACFGWLLDEYFPRFRKYHLQGQTPAVFADQRLEETCTLVFENHKARKISEYSLGDLTRD